MFAAICLPQSRSSWGSLSWRSRCCISYPGTRPWSCWETPEALPSELPNCGRSLGSIDPLVLQYARFLGNLLRGDLGRSIHSNRPVLEAIRQQAPDTIALTLAGLGLAVVLGISLGVLAACCRRSWLDQTSVALSLLGISLPSFWLGMLLIFVFALWLGWLPATGQGGTARLILPALTLGVQGMAVIALVTRAKTSEALAQEYVTTAPPRGCRRADG